LFTIHHATGSRFKIKFYLKFITALHVSAYTATIRCVEVQGGSALHSRWSSSCKEGFKSMVILTVPCLYIYALMTFVVRKCYIYQTNNIIHNINTRQQEKRHVSSVRLSLIQRGVLYSSIIIYNNLPQNIQILKGNMNIFRQTLKTFSFQMLFISIDEYISSKRVNSKTILWNFTW
jgi:hypothetical protein